MSDQPLNIRDAVVADAEAVCEVLRRSITELCAADHHHDLAIITQWLSNKTPPTVATWIGQPNNSFLVAVGANGRILGAASVTDKGEITLNYVSPDARFQGVSRALLHALETRAAARGSSRCALHSTVTALRFYRDAGYVEDRAPDGEVGASSGHLMSKRLEEGGGR